MCGLVLKPLQIQHKTLNSYLAMLAFKKSLTHPPLKLTKLNSPHTKLGMLFPCSPLGHRAKLPSLFQYYMQFNFT